MKQAKPMNQTTPLNSELLSADARGRKHIPVAVFAVIVIHIVLFLVLLIAAGCRSSARVKRSTTPQPEAAERNFTPPPATRMATALEPVAPAAESVLATEPIVEAPTDSASAPLTQEVTKVAPATIPPAPKAAKMKEPVNKKIYVVKAGDTLSEIAQRHGTTIQAVRTANKIKNNIIHPGQKLQLAPDAGRTAPLQVRTEKQKRSNEA
jgi:LysM repeat protein